MVAVSMSGQSRRNAAYCATHPIPSWRAYPIVEAATWAPMSAAAAMAAARCQWFKRSSPTARSIHGTRAMRSMRTRTAIVAHKEVSCPRAMNDVAGAEN